MEILVFAMLLGLIPGAIANSKGRSFFAWWLFGALIFIVALPLSLIARRLDPATASNAGLRRCPHCAELIQPLATVCKHCHKDVASLPPTEVARFERKAATADQVPAWMALIVIIGTPVFVGWWVSSDGEVTARPAAKPLSSVAATAPIPVPAAPQPPAHKWKFREETSPVDDTKNVWLMVEANETIPNRYGRQERPSLWARCKENTTSLFVNWEVYLGLDETDVLYRVDGQPAREDRWVISTSNDSTGRWEGATSIPFIKQLITAKQLFMRVTPHGESPVTVIFPVAGLDQVIQPLRTACHW
jgi:type VI secretion system VasI family protein